VHNCLSISLQKYSSYIVELDLSKLEFVLFQFVLRDSVNSLVQGASVSPLCLGASQERVGSVCAPRVYSAVQ